MTAYAPTNPFAPGTPNHTRWEETATKTLTPEQERLADAATDAYDRHDQAWFGNQPTTDLAALWDLVSGINTFTPAGPFDDEVYDALAARGWFDQADAKHTQEA